MTNKSRTILIVVASLAILLFRVIVLTFAARMDNRTRASSPQPIGTNKLQVGDIIYDPTSKGELWRVLAVEKWHEFDDGTEREGVLVRSSVNGGETWVPRENLSKALVGR